MSDGIPIPNDERAGEPPYVSATFEGVRVTVPANGGDLCLIWAPEDAEDLAVGILLAAKCCRLRAVADPGDEEKIREFVRTWWRS